MGMKRFIYNLNPGISQTQTFRLLCEKCETTKFTSYENHNLINSVPFNNHQYAELELKINIFTYNLKLSNHYFYEIAFENINKDIEFVNKSNFLNPDVRKLNLHNLF